MKPEKALNIIAAICSKKEHCSSAIREKLKKWELAEEEISKIMDFLYKHKFIDDARFAQAYAEDKFRFNKWGKQKIALMLRQKNISQDIINEVISSLNAKEYDETCLLLLKQKLKSIKDSDPYKIKAKLIRYGMGRGFAFEVINKCLSKMDFQGSEDFF